MSDVVAAAAQTLKLDPAVMGAVIEVETNGQAFLEDGRPTILFERHIFHRLTGGKFSASHPEISNPKAGGYGSGGANQWTRLEKARTLDENAALQSASWGLPQIMGFNFNLAGFNSVEAFVSAMKESEQRQIEIMGSFLVRSGLIDELLEKNWEAFALGYNGPKALANGYHTKLAAAYERLSKVSAPVYTPDQSVLQAQEAPMADAQPATPAALPEKSVLKSFSMWGALITLVLGWATQLGLPEGIAVFLQTNQEQIIGMVLQAIGLYQAWATLRRKTVIKA